MALAVSPQWGANRIKNKLSIEALSHAGYVVPGSQRKSMKGVTARAGSPDTDTIGKLGGMRGLSRDMYMNSPLAASILRRHRIHSIGSGLQVQSILDREFLKLTPEQATLMEKTIEREFDLWAESYNSDFDGINYYGDNQALGYLNMLLSGDFFFMPVWREAPEKDFPYELCIKLIDADLVRDPIGSQYNGLDIQGGVEKNSKGVVVAYHIWDCYSDAFTISPKSTRVPVYDVTGRKQIHHVFDPERISQRRGIPLLANVADSLKQLTRLSEAELMGALVSSFFTVFVKDMSGLGSLMGPAMTPEEVELGGGRYGPNEAEVSARNEEDGNDLEMGHGNIVYLDDKKDAVLADPGKVDKDFSKFWDSLAMQVCAGGNIPLEHAMMHYTTSYTAARAASIDVWQYRLTARTLVSRKMNQPVYQEFLTEAAIKGRVQLPGFFDDYATKRAWSNAAWVGSGQGSLDPLREAKAAVINLNNYLTNHEEQYAEKHGGRWDSAMNKRAREEKLLKELELVNMPAPDEIVGDDGQEDEDQQQNATD